MTELHPETDQLVAFGLGKLQPDEATRIEQHLESCPDCCATILNLQDDTFVGLVRQCEVSPLPDGSQGTLDSAASSAAIAGGPSMQLPAALSTHDRYEILELIGRGGMGDVYKAQHKLMNRVVALKVIKPQLVRNEAAVGRFRREVQAAAQLHHRHIVTAYDAERAGDVHFLVMEYVAGTNLDEVVRERGPLPVAEACELIRQAAEGLQHAADLGMVHRDIKPHNLMVTAKGELKILDFGLASFATEVAEEELAVAADASSGGAALDHLTQMGTMMGTPDYIAPEQAQDAHAADIRADIYSLGCTFYTLLAGRAPFDKGSVVEKIKAHQHEQPPKVSEVRSDVSSDLEALLLKMMAKDPAERYQTPAEVVQALARFIDERIDEKLRERGPGITDASGFHGFGQDKTTGFGDEARDWYDRLAGFMWSVACVNLLGGAIVAVLLAFLTLAGADNLRTFALHPLTLLFLASLVPGALLFVAAPKVRRMESYGWTLFAAFLCLIPSTGQVVGILVGFTALCYLLQAKYRQPLGGPARLSFVGGITLAAALLSPLAITAAGVVWYLQTDNGTVRVEVADESLQVTLSGTTVTAKDGEKTLSIRAGQPKLLVRRGDFQFETDSFQLRRGGDVTLKVDLLPGEVVVFKNGERFETGRLPQRQQPAGSADAILPPTYHGDQLARQPSEFFQSLDGLEAIVRKTLTDEGLTVGSMEAPKVGTDGSRCVIALDAELTGERDIGRTVIKALRGRIKALSGQSAASFSSLDSEMHGMVEAAYLPYTAGQRAGQVRIELRQLFPDKREPKTSKYVLHVQIEEWPLRKRNDSPQVFGPGNPSDKRPDTTNQLVEAGRFAGHEGAVNHAIALADELHAVSCGSDMTIRVWDLETQQERAVLRGHKAAVYGLAVSNDGKLLASSDKAGSIRLWNLETYEDLADVKGHEEAVTDLAFLPDGMLLSAGFDETLRLWIINPIGLSRVRTIQLGAKVEKMAPLWNGRVMLSGAHTGGWGMVTYDLDRGDPIDPQPSAQSCLAVSADRRKALIGSVTGLLRVTDMESGELVVQLADPRAKAAIDAAISPDGRFALTTTREGSMHLWDLREGKLLSTVTGETIGTVTLSSDGRFALTVGPGEKVGIWRLPASAPAQTEPTGDGEAQR